MNTLLYSGLRDFNKASIETDIKRVSIVICKVDKNAATSSIVFEKEFSTILFFLVLLPIGFLILLPFFLFYLVVVLPFNKIRDNLIKPKPEPTYEEACRWFEQGKGDYQNLSEAERKKRLARDHDLPLGL